MEWKKVNICDMCDSISATYSRGADMVVLINTSDVLDGKFLNRERVPNKDLKGQFKKTFQRDDILYSEIRPANKRFAYVDFDAIDYIASTKLMVLRAKPNVNPRFLYHILKSEDTLEKLQMLAESRSGTFPQITYSEMANVSVLLPDRATQDKIVAILSSLDDKIENNNRINRNLEAQAQALFKSWFVDFEPFGGTMPNDWREGTLGDICKQLKEKVGERDDVKVLSPVTTGKLMLSEEYFTKQVFSQSIAKYIIVPPTSFAYNPARVNIGSLGMNEYDLDGCVSPVYVVFECLDGYEYYFDLFRQTNMFKEEVKLRAIGGVRQSLNYEDFARITCNIPSKDAIEKFNTIYLANLNVRNHNSKENNRLAALRDTLLPKLMKGEIEV
ncbi:MAG: restriction endonuclease subunit S [Paludibacteraceae bacterium]|nr:restriction endonuclease subunit S [Paludibacteraceae bacterium]